MNMDYIYRKEDIDSISEKINNGEKLSRRETIWHGGMVGVRKKNLLYYLSDHELQEYIKCKEEPLYFIQNYCKVTRDDGSKGNIKLRDYQEDMVRQFKDERFILNLHSRQCGITSTYLMLLLHDMIFNYERCVLYIGNKRCVAEDNLNRMKMIYANLPFFLKPGIRSWDSSGIRFDNGSMLSTQSARNLVIGMTFHTILIDDFAYIKPKYKDIILSTLYPVVSSIEKSRLIINSPPNGIDTFYDMVLKAETGQNPFKLNKTYWWQVEGRDKKWKEEMIKMIGSESAFLQQYELCFTVK